MKTIKHINDRKRVVLLACLNTLLRLIFFGCTLFLFVQFLKNIFIAATEFSKNDLVIKNLTGMVLTTQTFGIDYLEIFSLVVKMNIVRILISLVAKFEWPLQQLNAKNDSSWRHRRSLHEVTT